MTANVQGSNILDVLKKKMRATKEESEKYKEECEDIQRKLQVELMRREEVSFQYIGSNLINLFGHINHFNSCRASMRFLLDVLYIQFYTIT